MDKREAARGMRQDGATIREIVETLGVTRYSATKWTADIRRPLTWSKARKSIGLRLGGSADLDGATLDLVAKKIRGDETIIACLSRLAVARCAEETSQKERN